VLEQSLTFPLHEWLHFVDVGLRDERLPTFKEDGLGQVTPGDPHQIMIVRGYWF
jgi:hypothetical protein